MLDIARHSVLRRMTPALAGFVLSAVTASAPAQQQSVPYAVQLEAEAEQVPRYAVEMIVFEYAGQAANSTEIFEPDKAVEVLPDELLFGDLPHEYSDRPSMPLPGADPTASIDLPATDELNTAADEPS